MHFDLPSHTILLTVAGSRAYGTHTEESDVDLKGVCIPPRYVTLGCLFKFEQAEGTDAMGPFLKLLSPHEQTAASENGAEGTVYALPKFMSLAADVNPNILDVLFCRDEEIKRMTKPGEILRTHRDIFLSTKAMFTFTGYAYAQLKRIESHRGWLLNPPKKKPERADFGLREGRPTVSKEQLRSLEHLSRDGLLELGLSEEAAVGISSEFSFRAAMGTWEKYESWKKGRNKKHAIMEEKFGLNCKHASHLVRLLRMGDEILRTGKVNVCRLDIDAEELMAIRNGAWSFEKIKEYAAEQEKSLRDYYESNASPLPKIPPLHVVNQLCVDLAENYGPLTYMEDRWAL